MDELARQLLDEHGLKDWRFELDFAKKRAGCCKYRSKTITLSYYYVTANSGEDILDTLLHEIAHAIAGPGTGHGPVWKAVCRRIGARPVRCYDSQRIVMPSGRYQATCPGCSFVFHRHKRPRAGERWCRKCGRTRGQIQYVDTLSSNRN